MTEEFLGEAAKGISGNTVSHFTLVAQDSSL